MVTERLFVLAEALADSVIVAPVKNRDTDAVAVAALDMVTVVPAMFVIMVPVGMPTPVTSCPTANPVVLATLVNDVLELVLPVVVKLKAAVFFTVVFAGIPVPDIGYPGPTPAITGLPVMIVLPDVILPVVVSVNPLTSKYPK
jgi:hypothetical protein